MLGISEDETFENALKSAEASAEQMNIVYQASTPDEYINTMVNIWLKRQISLDKTWGRVYSKGFRDIMQDVAALISFGKDIGAQKIINCLEHQRYNGNPLRAFEPINYENYHDGAVWIPATVLVYIKETGDASILDRKCAYFDNESRETVLEHIIKGIRFLLDNRGKNDMVLWGGGDWNDSINNAGNKLIGESAWLSIAAVKAIKEFCEILRIKGDCEDLISSLTAEKEELKAAIIKTAFENDRFIYGINDWGEKIGSKESKQSKIFLNTQTWAVLADILDKDGCEKLMDTVEREHKCEYGYVQCSPAYSAPDEHIGRVAYFIPGGYENGSVYNHGVAFKIAADCKLGRNDLAFKALKMIGFDNPDNPNSGVEPYAVSNMYLDPEEAYRKGFAPCSWITGTAGWLYRNITESILGITAEFSGLKISLWLPSKWNNVTVSPIYRGATYYISIKKTGAKSILVDGEKYDSDIIPIFKVGTAHNVIYTF